MLKSPYRLFGEFWLRSLWLQEEVRRPLLLQQCRSAAGAEFT
jgi:hypothetical protein